MSESRADELQAELSRRQELETELASRKTGSQPVSAGMVNTFLGPMRQPDMRPNPQDIDQMMRGFATGPGAFGRMGLYNIPKLGESISSIPRIKEIANIFSQRFPNVAPRIGSILRGSESPVTGGLIGAANVPENPLMGLALGGVAGAIPGAAKYGFNVLRPSNLFRGVQSPAELQSAMNVTSGTETPLGDVLQSPFLKGLYENVVAKVPFSGAHETMMKTAQDITGKGQQLMSRLLGKHSPANVEAELHKTLVDANKYHRKLKTELYNEPDKIANSIKLKLELPSFSNLAREYSEAIEGTNILKTEPEFRSLMNKLKGYTSPTEKIEGKIVSTEGKPIISEIKYPTLKEANILSSHLDDISERYSASIDTSNQNSARVFKRLSKSLKNDIKSSINQSGNKDLQSSFEKAEKNYAKNYSPFLEKEIYRFTSGKTDPDLIVQAFIKTGKATDRANLLEKFVTKLPESKRKLLGYAFLKRAINNNGEFDPLAFRQLISTKNLGPRQFDLLFPGKLGSELKNYGKLVEKNPEAFQLMKNPKTGQRLADIAAVGSAFAAPISTGVGILSARGLNKLMTSPKIRESLVNKMLSK